MTTQKKTDRKVGGGSGGLGLAGGGAFKAMVGGCCVCSEEQGWAENPLVYCDGDGCSVAVHKHCYGIIKVPAGSWFCRKCESQERAARVKCELCPMKTGALKRTDTGSWAHVVCALYIPEVSFRNVETTMEPIILSNVPSDRFLKTCAICEDQGKESRASYGACMQCSKTNCKIYFHVTCAQSEGLLCEEQNARDIVTYCGYCPQHYRKVSKRENVKAIPAFRDPEFPESTPESSPEKLVGVPVVGSGINLNDGVVSSFCASLPYLADDYRQPPSLPPSSASLLGLGRVSTSSGSPLGSPLGAVEEAGAAAAASAAAVAAAAESLKRKTREGSSDGSNASSKKTKKKKKRKPENVGGRDSDDDRDDAEPPRTTTSSATSSTLASQQEALLSKMKPTSVVLSQLPQQHQSFSSRPAATAAAASDALHRSLSRSSPSLPTSAASASPAERLSSASPVGGAGAASAEEASAATAPSHSLTSVGSSSSSVTSLSSASTVPFATSNNPSPPSGDSNTPTEGATPGDTPRDTPSVFTGDEEEEETVRREAPATPPAKCDMSVDEIPTTKITTKKKKKKKMASPNFDAASMIPTSAPSDSNRPAYVGPVPPTRRHQTHSVNHFVKDGKPATSKSSSSSGFPTSLDQLLEQHWDLGSHFIMSESEHFDIATLLQCLYQLKQENLKLEACSKAMQVRKEHLLAVNARLRISLKDGAPPGSVAASSSVPDPAAASAPPPPLPPRLTNGPTQPYESSSFATPSSHASSSTGDSAAPLSASYFPGVVDSRLESVVEKKEVFPSEAKEADVKPHPTLPGTALAGSAPPTPRLGPSPKPSPTPLHYLPNPPPPAAHAHQPIPQAPSPTRRRSVSPRPSSAGRSAPSPGLVDRSAPPPPERHRVVVSPQSHLLAAAGKLSPHDAIIWRQQLLLQQQTTAAVAAAAVAASPFPELKVSPVRDPSRERRESAEAKNLDPLQVHAESILLHQQQQQQQQQKYLASALAASPYKPISPQQLQLLLQQQQQPPLIYGTGSSAVNQTPLVYRMMAQPSPAAAAAAAAAAGANPTDLSPPQQQQHKRTPPSQKHPPPPHRPSGHSPRK